MKLARIILILALPAIISVCWTAPARQTNPQFSVLVFSKTTGFRHDSIPAAIAAIRQLGQDNNFAVDATEDSSAFNDANLSRYQAIIFLSTTGDLLGAEQKAAMQRFIRSGGGYAGIHSASDTEYNWPWYGGLVGAYFQNHPNIQTATIRVEDAMHPSTSVLPNPWIRNDEWYNFRVNPRGLVKALATLDESTYSGGSMGSDHPIAWCQFYGGGRSWYTAGGHTSQSYSEPPFLQHLLGGIQFAAGNKAGACSALAVTSAASFKPIPLSGDSIGSIFGASLSAATESATVTPLPSILAGTSVRVKDSAGKELAAPLFFVSPAQINFLLPAGLAPGAATITVIKENASEPGGSLQVAAVSPGLFSANANGQGVAAGLVLRIRPNGSRSFEPIARFDQTQNKFIPIPVNLGDGSDEVYLVLFGTGFRLQSTASMQIGGSSLPVAYAGIQEDFAGLDQINVRLPLGLAGRGEMNIEFSANGQAANIVTAAIQ